MRYGKIEGLAKPVSRLVQGTMMLSMAKKEDGFALLDAVMEQGCNTFDLAWLYNGGDAERVMGEWMQARGNREQVVIVTKGACPNKDRHRFTPFDVAADMHDSLARLKTDYIDVYMLHRDNPALPVGPMVECLNQHRREGRILVMGGSNWTHERIAEANDYARKVCFAQGFKVHGFQVSSPHLSLAEQVVEPWPGTVSISGARGEAARRWYAEQKMPLFVWSSLARGFFSGRVTRAGFESKTVELERSTVAAYCHPVNFDRLERAEKMAAEKGVTVPQIAMAWVMSQPLDVYALVGCMSGDEMKANVAAAEIELTPAEMAWLESGG
ncbi:MAG TPA: aldo/keto reductase [Candidatus Brocadiia bacterium]|nr:aldo/keto reductase [Candidatus Brocadiia bacterium]